MKKADVVQTLLTGRANVPVADKALAFAPTNIALCKYWGKRNTELNLPVTSSLSIALPDKGALTELSVRDANDDVITLNGEPISNDSNFKKRVSFFLDLFRKESPWYLNIDIKMNIPVAAGLASSACGFASLVSALNELCDWQLSLRDLSIMARLGSGSASRSLWSGFVEWHAGNREDGMDSFAEPLNVEWPNLCVGILSIDENEKPLSSREAMLRTVNSSVLYGNWPKKVALDWALLMQAMKTKKFALLGGTAESNALAMHATMLSSWPPVCYYLPQTIAAMQKVWKLREEGLEVYFTQDAGPNLKLLFLERDRAAIKTHFPQVETISVFE